MNDIVKIMAVFVLLASTTFSQTKKPDLDNSISRLNGLLQAHGIDRRENTADGRWWQDTYALRSGAGSAELTVNTTFKDGDVWGVVYRFNWSDMDVSRIETEKLAPGPTGSEGWVSRDVRYQVTFWTNDSQKTIQRTDSEGKVEYRDHFRIMFTDKFAAEEFVTVWVRIVSDL